MNPEHIARAYLERMHLPQRLEGAVIQLTDYESDADLKFLKSSDEWPLEFHREVNAAMSKELTKRGARVSIVKIRMADYFHWISKNKLKNTPANRAQFISEMTR